MSATSTSGHRRQGWKKATLWLLAVVAPIAIMVLLGRTLLSAILTKESADQPEPPPSFDAVVADGILSADVLRAIAAIDSYSKSRTGGSYKLYVLVDKLAEFRPVGFQLINAANETPIHVGALEVDPSFSCLRVDLKDAEGNVIYDRTDPYTSFRQGRSIAYQSGAIPLYQSGIDDFAKGERRNVRLLIELEQRKYVVEGLEISGQCTWIQD